MSTPAQWDGPPDRSGVVVETPEAPRWRAWLWKAPATLAAVVVLTVAGLVWIGHDDSMREQYELHLIDTEPHVMAVFDSLEDDSSGRRAWVRLQSSDEYKQLSQRFGTANLVPGSSLLVVVDPAWPDYAVQVYARDYLAEKFTRYPQLLDEQEMVAYQLSRPFTWIAGLALGRLTISVVALRSLIGGGVPSRDFGDAATQSRWAGKRRRPGRATGGVADPQPSFTLTRRNGYDPAGVDALLAQLADLPDTPDGHRAARHLISNARFHLVTGGGYNPVEVDAHLDKFVADRD